MKKTLYIVMALIVGVLMASCGKKSELEKFVEENNKQCPLQLDISGMVSNTTLQSMIFEDNKVVIQFEEYDFTIFKKDEVKAPLLVSFSYSCNKDEKLHSLFQLITEANCGLAIQFGEKRIFEYGPDEVKKAVNVTPLQVIQSMMQLTNSHCPMDMGNGMIFSKACIEGNYAISYIECDDDAFQQIIKTKSTMEIQLHEGLKEGKKATERTLMKESELGMKTIWVNAQSGEEVTITIENEEL